MTAKEYLNRAYRLNDKIKSNIRQLEALEEKATSVKSSLSPKVQGGTLNGAEQMIFNILDLKERINTETIEHMKTLEEIRQTIAGMKDPDESLLLTLRFVECMKWEEVAEIMGFSMSQVFRIYKRALNNFTVLDEGKKPNEARANPEKNQNKAVRKP